jgi:hypothetical protein
MCALTCFDALKEREGEREREKKKKKSFIHSFSRSMSLPYRHKEKRNEEQEKEETLCSSLYCQKIDQSIDSSLSHRRFFLLIFDLTE